ncbi:MAG: S1-C subfamily serine protease [Flavobacteriaceae bacterium]|jgi:S1-C subfamily serine protease
MRIFTLIYLIIFSTGICCAQEEEPLILSSPSPTSELLEQCSKQEAILLEGQIINKSSYEQNDLKTNELLQQSIESFSTTIDPVLESIIIDQSEQVTESQTAVVADNSELNKRIATGPSQYDSRVELLELSPIIDWQRSILDNSRSVGIIIERDRLSALTDTLYALDISTKLKTVFRLCPEEPYSEQLSLGVGTAFIVGEDIMMTASHVFEADIENYVVLFNFEIINRGGAVFPIVSKSDVYEIAAITEDNAELDILQFRVSRPLNAPVLKLATTNTLSKGKSIYMIGHPSGLPKKVALNASVYTNDNPFHFYSTLDAYQGNSGSPVFDMATHTVIGVLVSGSQDFTWTGHCNKSKLCYLPYCKGEKVIRFEQILNN